LYKALGLDKTMVLLLWKIERWDYFGGLIELCSSLNNIKAT
jgi:hypothetical protein